MSEICSNLTTKTPEQMVSLLLASKKHHTCSSIVIVDFEQANVDWVWSIIQYKEQTYFIILFLTHVSVHPQQSSSIDEPHEGAAYNVCIRHLYSRRYVYHMFFFFYVSTQLLVDIKDTS